MVYRGTTDSEVPRRPPGPGLGPGLGPQIGVPGPHFWVRDGSGRVPEASGTGPGPGPGCQNGLLSYQTVGFGRFSIKNRLFGHFRDLKCAFSKATVWVRLAQSDAFPSFCVFDLISQPPAGTNLEIEKPDWNGQCSGAGFELSRVN